MLGLAIAETVLRSIRPGARARRRPLLCWQGTVAVGAPSTVMTVSLQNEEWERARTARLARARKGTYILSTPRRKIISFRPFPSASTTQRYGAERLQYENARGAFKR